MAGYRTRTSWSAPNIEFDSAGRRVRPHSPDDPTVIDLFKLEPCRAPVGDGTCVKHCGERCRWGVSG